MAMVLSVLASRPRVRASIIAAIDKDIEARTARARALGLADTSPARNRSARRRRRGDVRVSELHVRA
jgi:hypothetical protein